MTPLHVRDRLRRLPAGDFVVHAGVFLLGAALIAVGFVAVVLPGPLTIPPILLGLAVWSLEFEFAAAWLERTKGPARKAWVEAKAHPWRTGVVTGGGIALAVVAAVLVSQYELVDRAKDALT